MCISHTASPTPLLTDVLWNKEGTLLPAPRLTANPVKVLSDSWPMACASFSGPPRPLLFLLLLKLLMIVDKLIVVEYDKVRGITVVFTV